MGNAARSLKGVLGTLGVALSAAGLGAMVKSALDSADALSKLSQRVGITVESLSLLMPAAELSGVSAESSRADCAVWPPACWRRPDHPPITEEEGETFLRQDLRTALAATLRYCPVLAAEPEKRLAAIVDFTFNLGAGRLQMSTLRRRVNERDWEAAARELRRWVYGGGRVLPGLVARRSAETTLLLSPNRTTSDSTQPNQDSSA